MRKGALKYVPACMGRSATVCPHLIALRHKSAGEEPDCQNPDGPGLASASWCVGEPSHVIRLFVTLVDYDHIGWKSWKLIARTISPTPSLFVAKIRSTHSQGNMGKFWGDYRWGREKVACWRTKAAISLKRVNIEEKLLWTAYRNSPTLFRTVTSEQKPIKFWEK